MIKSAEAFRTISEVAELLDTPAHVLRFWESRFSQLKPVKRAGGRRYYRPGDVALLGGIKQLLHEDGLTIRGVQKILREQGQRHVAALSGIDLVAAAQAADGPAVAAEASMPSSDRTVSHVPTLEQALHAVTSPPSREQAEPPVQADWLNTAPPARLWPETSSPEVADSGDDLLHDPEDFAPPTREEAPEAPMEIDAPLLPLGETASLHTFERPNDRPTDAAAPDAPAIQPAATLLRAMDALRARDNRTELRTIHRRLTDLRGRMGEENAKPLK